MTTARDLVFISATLLLFGFLFFIVNFSAHTMVDRIVSIPAVNTSTQAITAFNSASSTTNRFDYLFLGVFIGLVVAGIVTGWFVGGEPIFMIFYFLIAVMAVIASVLMANAWYDITTQSVFGTTINHFPITNHILSNLPIYVVIISTIGIFVMFSRPFLKRGL